MRFGINGMGRIGRLALRSAAGAAERPEDDPRTGNRLDVVHVNEREARWQPRICWNSTAFRTLARADRGRGQWRHPDR